MRRPHSVTETVANAGSTLVCVSPQAQAAADAQLKAQPNIVVDDQLGFTKVRQCSSVVLHAYYDITGTVMDLIGVAPGVELEQHAIAREKQTSLL
jgi:hypothetical protein